MPELPGALVFMSGHVGVYIGDGYVVEARGHNYGVVKTKLSARAWKTWGKHPLIDYGSGTSTTPVNTTNKTVKELTGVSNIKNGDKDRGVQAYQAILVRLGIYVGINCSYVYTLCDNRLLLLATRTSNSKERAQG